MPTNPKMPPFTPSDASPEERMHWVKVPFSFVLDLYNAQTLKVQRHHLRRAKHALHLTGVDIPLHVNYVAGRTPDGKMRLVDGYTRVTAILNGDKPSPSTVWLGVVDCDTPAELEKMYDAMDSRQAVKRGRDAFEEGLRRANLINKVQSPLFTKGQAVSAITAAYGSPDVRKATYELRHGIQVLDKLGISAGPKKLPSGALAALLLMAADEKDSEAVQKFAAALQNPDAVPPKEKSEVAGALRSAKDLEERRQQGSLSGRNVVPIMESVLGYWDWQKHGGKGSPHPLSRADYISSVAAR